MTFLRRFLALFRRAKLDREMDAEMRAHLARETEANIARGMSPDEARRAARRAFGGIDRIQETERDSRGLLWMENITRDVRHAVRSLRKTPRVTAIAVVVLAVGIGACTAIFSVTNAVLFQPLSYDHPQQLVQVYEDPTGTGTGRNVVSGGCFEDWRTNCRSFEDLAALWRIEANLTGSSRPERLVGAEVSACFFDLLRVRPEIGRGFLPDEERPGSERVVVITHALWQERYSGTPDVVGKTLELGGIHYAIVGVLPSGFSGSSFVGRNTDFWIPFAWGAEDWHRSRENHRLRVFGRLAHGITADQARAELATVVESHRTEYPFWKQTWSASITPLREAVVGGVRPLLLMLLGAVGFVLLIVCANVANLMLVRGMARERELVVRSALGATRWRITQQLLIESLVLSLAGGLLGVIAAYWIRDVLIALSPQDLPRLNEITIDLRVLAFSFGVSVATGVFCGIVPAWRLAQTHLESALREGGRASSSVRASHRIAGGLVAAEVAIAVMLLVGAGLFLRSLQRLYAVDPGVNTSNVLALQLSLSDYRYPRGDDRARFFRDALEKIDALPGVTAAGVCTSVPLRGPSNIGVKLEGRPNSEYFGSDCDFASSDYFDALGIPLVRGRFFDPADNTEQSNSIIVNEAFVRRCLAGVDPIGRRVATGGGLVLQIVGVVGNIRDRSLARAPEPHLYQPIAASSWHDFHLFVQTVVAPRSVATSVRKAILAVDSDQPVAMVRTLEDVVAESVGSERFTTVLSGSFAMVALVLAAIAVFGVVSCGVARRTREIGVRLALGAKPATVVALIIRQSMSMVWIGLGAGLAGTLGLSHLLDRLLFGVSSTDPGTIAAVMAVLAAAALLAAWLPARRAAKVDPMIALRAE